MTFYDHATNHASAAEAWAVARVRREAIETRQAYRVEANWPGKERFYWDGGRMDSIQLAKMLERNGAERVELTNPQGEVMIGQTILELQY